MHESQDGWVAPSPIQLISFRIFNLCKQMNRKFLLEENEIHFSHTCQFQIFKGCGFRVGCLDEIHLDIIIRIIIRIAFRSATTFALRIASRVASKITL